MTRQEDNFGNLELNTMWQIICLLEPLDSQARTRVLAWVESKIDELNEHR